MDANELKPSSELKKLQATQYDVQELAVLIRALDRKVIVFISEIKSAKALDKRNYEELNKRVGAVEERADKHDNEMREVKKYFYMVAGGAAVIQFIIQYLF